MVFRKRRSSYTSVEGSVVLPEKKKMPLLYKYLIIFGVTLLTIALLLFILVFVVFPITFMLSIKLQRFFMFFNVNSPKNPQFNSPHEYGIEGVNNFYITVKDLNSGDLVSIGAWEILPDAMLTAPKNVNVTLLESSHPVLLYFHGVLCNRIKPIAPYQALRKHFLIIAIDYRDFGDSTGAPLSENGVVDDAVQVYKWVRSKTTADIYVWGHSLGTALSTHTVRLLKTENIVPMGLVLESPFSTMREEIVHNTIGKIFSWLAFFKATVLDPLRENGFRFETTTNILYVDCPIMIMHAEDDNVIPYFLGKKLYEIAKNNRAPEQGNVTYHQFSGNLGYKHLDITSDPNMARYIDEFVGICESYRIGRN